MIFWPILAGRNHTRRTLRGCAPRRCQSRGIRAWSTLSLDRSAVPAIDTAVERGMHFGPARVGTNAVDVREAVLVFAIYLVLVIALPVALSSLMGYRSLPRGVSCPNCAQDTLPLVSYPIWLAKQMNRNFSLQRRWCPTCEWDGYARVPVSPIAMRLPDSVHRYRQQVRTIEIGGRPWSVMLESWREHGRFYGRLIFAGPSGKLWCDALPAFNGPTQHDVLEQALALSDRLLAYRLRDVISG